MILSAIEQGDGEAAEQLLPLVYEELRKLAAARMAQEKPGQTLQATALVHDAYIRLVDVDKVQHWNSRGHFFSAAAEAMRRILIEQARRKAGPEPVAGIERVELSDVDPADARTSVGSACAERGDSSKLSRARSSCGGTGQTPVLCWLDASTGGRRARAYRPQRPTTDWAFAKGWLRVDCSTIACSEP